MAVGFLYYKQFSGSNADPAVMAGNSDSTGAIISIPAAPIAQLPKNIPLVFVNADTLFAKYELAKKTKTASEGKIARYQKSYQNKAEALQKEYNDYMEKAGAGAYTKEQGLAIEEGLQKKNEEIMAMKQNEDKMMNELDNSNMEIQKKIYNYLSRFNKEHGYYCVLAYTKSGGGVLGINDSLDVTAQVVAGLNNEYKSGIFK